MYKVLLVDDEPIIISGIKFLIDWDKYNCQVIDSASNGKIAIEYIEKYQPDIILCDINMPVMTGLELLKIVVDRWPNIVFIMLTNHQEFDMAQSSLRYKAVDYLLKSDLTSASLEKSLSLAISEANQRNKLDRVDFAESYIETNTLFIISDNLTKIYHNRNGSFLNNSYAILEENDILKNYFMIEIVLNFDAVTNINSFNSQDKKRLFETEKDIITKITKNFYQSFTYIITNRNSFILFMHHQFQNNPSQLSQFYAKLSNTSQNILQINISLLYTKAYHDKVDLIYSFDELDFLEDYYFNNGGNIISLEDAANQSFTQEFSLQGTIRSLASLIKSKESEEILQVFDDLVEEIKLKKLTTSCAKNAVWSLYEGLSSLITTHFPNAQTNVYFFNKHINDSIDVLTYFDEIVNIIKDFKNNFTQILFENTPPKQDTIAKAKQYILDNILQKISLNDVASAVNISPSYLSAIFKKQYNQNFVDFINEAKIKKACALLKDNKLLIYQISYMLGFENAYYFSKVFKKHIGVTPKEFQNSLQNSLGEKK